MDLQALIAAEVAKGVAAALAAIPQQATPASKPEPNQPILRALTKELFVDFEGRLFLNAPYPSDGKITMFTVEVPNVGTVALYQGWKGKLLCRLLKAEEKDNARQQPAGLKVDTRTLIPGSAVSAVPQRTATGFSVHADGITATLFGPEGASRRAYKSGRGWVQVGAGKPPTWYQRGLIELNQAP